MQQEIRNFVLGLLEKKARLPGNFNDNDDYISAGIVDSIGIIKFTLELEARFDIEITDTDLESNDFRSVQGLVTMITRKIAKQAE
jgi:acyl carrier protein